MVLKDIVEQMQVRKCPKCESFATIRYGDDLTMGQYVGDEYLFFHGQVVTGRCKYCGHRWKEMFGKKW